MACRTSRYSLWLGCMAGACRTSRYSLWLRCGAGRGTAGGGPVALRGNRSLFRRRNTATRGHARASKGARAHAGTILDPSTPTQTTREGATRAPSTTRTTSTTSPIRTEQPAHPERRHRQASLHPSSQSIGAIVSSILAPRRRNPPGRPGNLAHIVDERTPSVSNTVGRPYVNERTAPVSNTVRRPCVNTLTAGTLLTHANSQICQGT